MIRSAYSASRMQNASSWARRQFLPAMLLVVVVFAAYSNTLSGPPVFDSQTVFYPGSLARAPWRYSIGSEHRPVVELSFALNHALWGEEIAGYHLFNTAVHALAALVLYWILRRTFAIPTKGRPALERSGRWLALSVAMIWAVHPLNTQAVRYLVQRAESMMGLFYLLVLYCGIRAIQSERTIRSVLWSAMAVLCFCLGLATKLPMVSAPVFLLLYDRAFLSGSLRKALHRNWHLYGVLLLSFALLPLLGLFNVLLENSSAGFGVPVFKWYHYLATQPGVILHYLRLVFWPHPLCLDYGWPLSRQWQQIVPQSAAVLALLTATGYMLWRNWRIGLLGAWFFMILAPTSSFIPVLDCAFEHRMYLPSAAVTTGAIILCYEALRVLRGRIQGRYLILPWISRGAVVAVVAIVAACGAATLRRNWDYRSRVAIWQDTVAKAPSNPRAYYNLAVSLQDEERFDEAIDAYRNAIAVLPVFGLAHNNLGALLDRKGETEAAMRHFYAALQYGFGGPVVLNNLAAYWLGKGEKTKALAFILESLRHAPKSLILQFKAAELLAEFGAVDRAIEHYREVLRIYPQAAEAMTNLAMLLETKGEIEEAVKLHEQAIDLRPDSALMHNSFGALLMNQGRSEEGMDHFREAMRLAPDFADPHCNLAISLESLGRRDEADEHFQQAMLLNQANVQYRLAYGRALQSRGEHLRAVAVLEEALKIAPENETAMYWLAESHRDLGDASAAERYFEMISAKHAADAEMHYRFAAEYLQENNFDAAIVHLGLGLRLKPESREMLLELAWLLAVHPSSRYRHEEGAVRYAERARALQPEDPIALKVLAAAYASASRFDEAVATARSALRLAEVGGQPAQVEIIRHLLEIFEAGKPYRQDYGNVRPTGRQEVADAGTSDS